MGSRNPAPHASDSTAPIMPAGATVSETPLKPPPTLGRTHRRENFPVASRLLGERVRPHVMAFYGFARAADEIADDPRIDPDDKLASLETLDRIVTGEDERADGTALQAARGLRASLDETGVNSLHARHLLQAFQKDAVTRRYPTWGHLLAYCRYSAVPVGRYLLELHGETNARAVRASDALCIALQVINHLQDCRVDYETLDRVYVPGDWLAEAGLDVSALGAERASVELRRVFDRMLERTERMILEARPLVGTVGNRRLRLESAVVLVLAGKLARKLRRIDPLSDRAHLTPLEKVLAAGHGLMMGFCGR